MTRPRLRKWISLEDATLFVDTIEAIVDLVDDSDAGEADVNARLERRLSHRIPRTHNVARHRVGRPRPPGMGAATPTNRDTRPVRESRQRHVSPLSVIRCTRE